jgi:hypothetical protein
MLELASKRTSAALRRGVRSCRAPSESQCCSLSPSLALLVTHSIPSISTWHSRFGELLLCTLQESIDNLGVPSSVNNADAQLRACHLLATLIVCHLLTSLPTVVLLAAPNSFDSRHDVDLIVCVLVFEFKY